MVSLTRFFVLFFLAICFACTPIVFESYEVAYEEPYIGPPRLKNFELLTQGDSITKLIIEVEGDDVELGTFFVRMSPEVPPHDLSNFFLNTNGFWYLNGTNTPNYNVNIFDNSVRDEDSTTNVFAYTFRIEDFPDTTKLFYFIAGWHNRPQSGSYFHVSNEFTLKGGKVDNNISANIESPVHRVVYMNDSIYASFPNMFLMDGGTIGISFGTKTVRSHIDPTGGSLSLVSNNGGANWQNPTAPLYDQVWVHSGQNLVFPLAQGWVETPVSLRDSLIAAQRVVRDVREGVIAYLGGARVRRSANMGSNWMTEEIAIPTDCSGLYNHHSAATYIVSSANTRIRAIYGRRKANYNNDGKDEVYFLRSEDDGDTWVCHPMYPSGVSGLEVTGFNESSLVETANGKLVLMMRSVPEGHLWYAESNDDGLTWGNPVKTPLWGHPAHVIKLSDGRLLCAYGYRRYPMGIRAAISGDNGLTWDIENEIIIRKDGKGAGGDLGYPLIHQLSDGSIFSVYYLTTDAANTHIATTNFHLP